MPARASRRLAALLGLALCSAPLAAQQDTGFVELLVDVRIDRGPSAIMLALARDTTVLVTAGPLLALAEIAVTASGPARLTAAIEPTGPAFRLDADSGLIVVNRERRAVPAGHLVTRDGELYVSTDVLAAVLNVHLSASLAELTVQVRNAAHLPAVRRLERARRRARLAADRAPPPALVLAPERPLVDGAVFDWGITSLTEDPLDASSLRLGLGAQILGGSAVVEHVERRTSTGAERETRGSWIRAWHTTPWVRQLRLGDVQGTGRTPRVVQGGAVTNAPFLRPAEFAVEPLDGTFGPGWEVELYRNEQFVGYTTTGADGSFRFDVPVRYGQNPLEVVGYGPHGQVVRRERTFEVVPLRLPGRQFEYGVAGGGCAFDPCEALLNVDARYGVSDRLTVQTGVDRFWRDTLPDLWHPYAAVTGQPARSFALTGEAVLHALLAVRVDFAPTPDLQAAVGHTRFDTTVVQPLVGSPIDRDRTDAIVFYRPGLFHDQLFFRLSAFRLAGAGRTRSLARLIATTRFLGTRVDAGGHVERLALDSTTPVTTTGFEARFFHGYTGPLRWLRRTLFQGEMGVNLDSGLTRARFGVTHAIRDRFQIDAGVDWQRGVPGGVAFELGLTATLHPVRAISRNRFSGEGTRGTQVAEGAMIWDRNAGRIGFSDGRALGRAGLAGEVFLDLDGDGVADQGEPPVAGIRLRIGPRVVTTDSAGRFAVWDLVPFELLIVEVDTLSNDDPLRVPVASRFTFRPDPNTFTRVPIPFVRGGEVSGRVLFNDTQTGVGGAPVVLRARTGERYTTTTFSDGGFYLLGVRPGDYEATVDDSLLERLGARVAPARFTVGAARDAAIVENVEVRLRS